jgi:hypothetical protein
VFSGGQLAVGRTVGGNGQPAAAEMVDSSYPKLQPFLLGNKDNTKTSLWSKTGFV